MASFLDTAALDLAELAKCSRCGRCQAVCPVYLATSDERLVARGKLALIEAARGGGLEPSAAFVDTISRCLLCGACRGFCARGVATDQLIQQVRAAAASALGLPRTYQLLFAGLASPRLLGAISRAGGLLQGLSSVIPGAPLSLLPWVGKYARHLRLATRPYLSARPPQGQGRTGLFVGCGANYLWPEAAADTARLLEAAGVAVSAPAAQVCCGLPAASAGDAASAGELARRNVAAFEGFESVVCLCASCAYRLRALPGMPPVRLFSEVLEAAPAPPPRRRRLRVAYHAPCHARFEGAGPGALLARLAALPGVELLAAEEGCCGSGGLFGLTHPKLSQAILRRRLASLLALRPEAIVTDCTGCRMQLAAGLAQLERAVPVLHPAQVLARADLC